MMGKAKWWTAPHRMVQTNLREIDADLDPDRLVDDVRRLRANVLLFNVGGILASYPTELDIHYRNPHLRNDLVGEVQRRCHAHGIRFLGRFDFSKANRVFYGDHPDWFFRTAHNTVVDYNGQLHTCVNGPFQEVHSLEILTEVLDRYPLDGMFFNMFGYQTVDYDENYHGLCHCENCRERFRAFSGHDLPRVEDPDDPIYRLHQRFRAEASQRMRDAIVDLAHRKRGDELLISGDSMVRRESNTKLSRPLPLWVYEASDHSKTVMDSWADKAVANAAVHFLDIPYRHVSVPTWLTGLRVAQNIAGGAWPDFYCIGTLVGQQDRTSFPLLHELYGYHAEHAEEYYTELRPAAATALLTTRGHEYRGVFRALVENHRPFDVLDPVAMTAGSVALDAYELVVAPDAAELPGDVLAALDTYVEAGGRLLCTGRLPVIPNGRSALEGEVALRGLGARAVREHRNQVRSAQLLFDDKARFPRASEDVDLTWLDRYYQDCLLHDDASSLLRFIPPSMYGPPEKCYYDTVTDLPGVIARTFGQGASAALPWPIGELYYTQSSPTHAALLADVIAQVLDVEPQLRTDASAMVEFSVRHQSANGRVLLHLVNSSGHHGTAFHRPVPMADIDVAVRRDDPVTRVRALRGGEDLAFEQADGWCAFTVPRLDLMEAVAIE